MAPQTKTALNIDKNSIQPAFAQQISTVHEADKAAILETLHAQDSATMGAEASTSLGELDQDASDPDDINQDAYSAPPNEAAQDVVEGTSTQYQVHRGTRASLEAELGLLLGIKLDALSAIEQRTVLLSTISKPSLIVKLRVIQPFPLMRLPLEIRNMIYKETLIMPSPIMLEAGYGTWIKKKVYVVELSTPTQASICNLFQASRTLYRETIPIYFGHNTFKVDSFEGLTGFLTSIGPDYRRNIHSLDLTYSGKAPAKAMKLLTECIGLRSLRLCLTYGTLEHVRRACQLSKMNGAKDLFRLRGIEQVVLDDRELSPTYNWLDFDQFKKDIEVVKMPHTEAQLKRQEQKDYPHKATRTVFGKANVMTRTEKQVMGKQLMER